MIDVIQDTQISRRWDGASVSKWIYYEHRPSIVDNNRLLLITVNRGATKSITQGSLCQYLIALGNLNPHFLTVIKIKSDCGGYQLSSEMGALSSSSSYAANHRATAHNHTLCSRDGAGNGGGLDASRPEEENRKTFHSFLGDNGDGGGPVLFDVPIGRINWCCRCCSRF